MPMSPKEMLTLLKENGFETVNQKPSNRKNGNRSLSLQRSEKGIGAGNT